MSIKISSELLKKYAENRCSAEEKIYIELWYNEYASKKQSQLPDIKKLGAANEEIWKGISRKIGQNTNVKFSFIKVAAAILILASISFIIYKASNQINSSQKEIQTNFVTGKVKAEVYASSHRSIVYGNSDIKKIMSELRGDQEIKISTQVGEEYHAVLPDGSEIWLNANSEIVIPASFNKAYRDLNLQKGEAYFKVAKNKFKPFRVFAAKTKIEALGTEFNVRYDNESKDLKAFLVEGSISVSKKNEQSVIRPNQLYQGDDLTGLSSISEMQNPTTQYAWKSGYFEYANTPLPEILKDLSRWYNFNFEIHQKYRNKTLTGKIARKQPFNEVLAILEFSGIKYRKEGSNLILEP
ncbi:FecR family protein [Pedobacter insulae]|uniref:FecR protein n=1 Tax=Pedobacter insulae TaxID=414048 RepID=A0A1I2VRD4_9SPHI|nr:FecR family protein [Pedobacter insulae]SFG90999.1 protein of unknown function [Pedobacter insulae]